MRKSGRDEVATAMASVPREDFLPEEWRELADVDRAIPIGYGQTNSQPRTVAHMLRLLDVQPGQRVLDLGAGSGWTTALLGYLVGDTGVVIGVELVPELVHRAAAAVSGHAMPWAEVRQADPEILGAPAQAPFERILVSAEVKSLPNELVDQLGPGGIMVIPVRSEMLRVTKARADSDGVSVTRHGLYSFVPLL